MSTLFLLALLALAPAHFNAPNTKENTMPAAAKEQIQQEKKQAMTTTASFKRITPVLFAPAIEPCLSFWEKIGFTRTMEVPAGNTLAFAALHKNGLEVMYQSYASAEKDASATAAARQSLRSSAFLYVEVDNLQDVLRELDVPLEVAPHDTFYGAREAVVRDPAGHFITFAQFAGK